MRRSKIFAPLAVAALVAAACGSTSPSTAGAGSAAPPSAAAAQAAAVTIKGFAFAPASLTVAKGTKVTFSNQDGTTHTVTSGANRTKDGKFDRQLSGGTEDSITFDTAGTFEYFCNIHQSMKATVVVN
jgi:plastocyanin